jgi:hypothetical protein
MKKITIILSVIFLMLCNSCKKEDTLLNNESNFLIEKSPDYYTLLSSQTNVDIYKLASSPKTKKFFETTSSIGKEIIKNMRSPGDFTEEELARIDELMNLILQAVQDHNFQLIDYYWRELSILLFGTVHPWQLEESLFYRSEIIGILNEEIINFFDYLNETYPSFNTLDENIQFDVLHATAEIILRQPPGCKEAFDAAVSDALITYGISSALCLASGPGFGLCQIAATAFCARSLIKADRAYSKCMGW